MNETINRAYIAAQLRQLATAEHHYTLQLGSDAGGKTNHLNITPSQFAMLVPLLLIEPDRNLYHQLNRLLAQARGCIDEPIALEYAPDVFIEVRPITDDNRVSVMKRGHGFTCVNYTPEGVIVDVIDENTDEVHTVSITNDGLTLPEGSDQQQQPD